MNAIRYEERLRRLEQAILAQGADRFPALRYVRIDEVEDAVGRDALLATVGLALSPGGWDTEDWFWLSSMVDRLAAENDIDERVRVRMLTAPDFVRLENGELNGDDTEDEDAVSADIDRTITDNAVVPDTGPGEEDDR